jgi:hypothetical protein
MTNFKSRTVKKFHLTYDLEVNSDEGECILDATWVDLGSNAGLCYANSQCSCDLSASQGT